MIHITEDKLKAAIQICLGGDSIYTKQREAKLVHDIKALSIADVSGSFTSKFQEIIYSDLSDSEIVNALHKLDNDR